jgi:hypothetical protein
LIKTNYPDLGENLLFIDLLKNHQDLSFTVYNADLFVDIKNSNDNVKQTVIFMRNKSLVYMDWGSPVHKNELQESSLSTKPPQQPTSTCFYFLPIANHTRFTADRQELNK